MIWSWTQQHNWICVKLSPGLRSAHPHYRFRGLLSQRVCQLWRVGDTTLRLAGSGLRRCHQGLSRGQLVSSVFRAISCTLLGLWVWSLSGPACYFQTFCLCSIWSWNQDAALGSSEEELYFEGRYYRNVESLRSAISRSFFYLIPPVFRKPWPKFSIPFPFILHHLSLKEKKSMQHKHFFFFFFFLSCTEGPDFTATSDTCSRKFYWHKLFSTQTACSWKFVIDAICFILKSTRFKRLSLWGEHTASQTAG